MLAKWGIGDDWREGEFSLIKKRKAPLESGNVTLISSIHFFYLLTGILHEAFFM